MSRAPAVLFLNQTAHPDLAATAQHLHDLAAHLVRAGWRVRVVASRTPYGERGRAMARREIVDGVEIRRTGRSLFGKGALALRALDQVAFAASAFFVALCGPRPDVVVSLTSPPFIGVVGSWVARLRGARHAVWLMDLYPEVAIAAGALSESGLIARLARAANVAVLRRADAVVALGRCMRRRLLDLGVDASGLHVISPWSDAAEVDDRPRRQDGLAEEWGIRRDDCVVLYSGNMGIGHDVATPLEAAALLSDRSDIVFAFAGSGKRKDEVVQRARALGLDRLIVKPSQPRERLGELLALADIHLITLRADMAGLMVPSKLYGILASGRPAVFAGPAESEVSRVLDEASCGVTVANGDAQGMARAITRFADDRALRQEAGSRARSTLLERFDRPLACERWGALLLAVTRGEAALDA